MQLFEWHQFAILLNSINLNVMLLVNTALTNVTFASYPCGVNTYGCRPDHVLAR